ncbi:hypothetical protein ES703_122287 [subsurface metagenome]
MIRSVIKSAKGMVLVFDEKGKQMPQYQGRYDKVRGRILHDAPADAVFWHDEVRQLKAVGREEW